jgi:hypothetical protein
VKNCLEKLITTLANPFSSNSSSPITSHTQLIMGLTTYSALDEAQRMFGLLCKEAEELGLPSSLAHVKGHIVFKSDFNRVYFPIPLNETETASALKELEGCVALHF